MTIRATIMALAVPLFLALAAVNGALLLLQERKELRNALDEQARAVAVTMAEFVAAMDDPQRQLAEPPRQRAMATALARVESLDGAWLVEPDRPAIAIAVASDSWDPSSLAIPTRAEIIRPEDDTWIAALAPAGGERFVAVRLSATPILEHMDARQARILLVVLLLGLVAAGLSWFVARRITRELRINREALSRSDQTETEANAGARLGIREARDLADAVRLMDASRQAVVARDRLVMARRECEHDPQRTLDELRSTIFAPVSAIFGGAEVALRICGKAPAGSFFAVRKHGGRGAIVLGRCAGDTPFDALANAMEARQLIQDGAKQEDLDALLALLHAAFPIEALKVRQWTLESRNGEAVELLSLADARTAARAEAYGKVNAALAPQDVLAGLEILLDPDGVFAMVRPGASSGGGERGLQIGLDREDAAETADVEDFADGRGKAAQHKPVA